MKLKTLFNLINIFNTISKSKPVKIVNHDNRNEIIWKGIIDDILNCPIIDNGFNFVEILLDESDNNEIIITVV